MKKQENHFDFIRIEITDSGVGIPVEKMQYIFNLFETDINEINNNLKKD